MGINGDLQYRLDWLDRAHRDAILDVERAVTRDTLRACLIKFGKEYSRIVRYHEDLSAEVWEELLQAVQLAYADFAEHYLEKARQLLSPILPPKS